MIKVYICSLDRREIDGIQSLTIYSSEGSLGIMSNHIPIVSVIDRLLIKRGDRYINFNLDRSLFYFKNNVAKVIVERVREERDV